MNYVKIDGNNIVTHTNGSTPRDGFIEAPDHVGIGYQKNGETWQKSAALLAEEAADADRETKREAMEADITTLLEWADFHENTVFNGWDASTTADKLAATKTLHRRVGIFFRRFAGFYQGHKFAD